MIRKIFTSVLFFAIINVSLAQEFDCNLTVNIDQVGSKEVQIFEQMQQDLFEFVNTQRWTDDVVSPEERIKCDIIVNITKISGQSNFTADIMIQSSRPVYGVDYDSPLFNYVDKNVSFEYQQGQPLFFTPNTFNSNLTSVMAFYIYIILGYDYDSFAKNGGTIYFDKANDVMLNAVQSGDKAWTADSKNRSRYNLISQLMNPQYSAIREGNYKYHRLALDNFSKDQVGGRTKISQVLNSLKRIFNINPNSPVLSSFFESKSIEITNIYKKASVNEKQAILKILRQVDAINMDKYNKILQGR